MKDGPLKPPRISRGFFVDVRLASMIPGDGSAKSERIKKEDATGINGQGEIYPEECFEVLQNIGMVNPMVSPMITIPRSMG